MPRPIAALGIWPVRQSTGALVAYAVLNAAVVFSTPGPGTTVYTPGLPVDRE